MLNVVSLFESYTSFILHFCSAIVARGNTREALAQVLGGSRENDSISPPRSACAGSRIPQA